MQKSKAGWGWGLCKKIKGMTGIKRGGDCLENKMDDINIKRGK